MTSYELKSHISNSTDSEVGSFWYDPDGPLGSSLMMLGARTVAVDDAGCVQAILFPPEPEGARADQIGRNYIDDVAQRMGLERRSGLTSRTPADSQDLVDRLHQVIADGGSVDIPPSVWDGVVTGLSIRVRHRVDENGHIAGRMVVEIPVSTMATEAANEAFESHRQAVLDALLSTSPYRIWWKDQRSAYLGCNRVFAQNAGLESPDDIVGKNDFDFPWAETGAAKMREDDQEVLRNGTPKLEFRETLVQAESTIEVSASKVPLVDSAGEVLGVLGMFCDITDQVMTQRALDDERARMAQIVETIPFAVAWKDRDHRYVGCNEIFASQAGLGSQDDIVGLRAEDLSDVRPTAASLECDEQLMATGQELLHERVSIADDRGQQRTFDVSRVPLRNADGDVTGLLILAIDHSERTMLESQLSDVSKMEAIGQLASGVAHEINTPIQFVGDNVGFLKSTFDEIMPMLTMAESMAKAAKAGEPVDDVATDLLQEFRNADLEFLVDEIPKAIEQSVEGIGRVTKIVRGLKEFAHPGADEPEPSDLNHTIESTVAVAANEWKYVADVEFDLRADLPTVSCMPTKLAQALLIIIVNAAQAIGEANKGTNDRGRIEIASDVVDGQCEIRITDDGPGMTEAVRSRIFEPFFTTKDVGVGSGQGLSIAQRIVVSDHGGSLGVRTAPGRGTTFVLRIPFEAKQVG